MTDDLTVSEAAKKQILTIANELGERLKSIVANDMSEAVGRRQRFCGEMEQQRQAAERERDELIRATAAKRVEGVRLDEENSAKQRRGVELDAQNAVKDAALREKHDEFERITAAVVAAGRAARPAVAV
jgi:hypothetical protein